MAQKDFCDLDSEFGIFLKDFITENGNGQPTIKSDNQHNHFASS